MRIWVWVCMFVFVHTNTHKQYYIYIYTHTYLHTFVFTCIWHAQDVLVFIFEVCCVCVYVYMCVSARVRCLYIVQRHTHACHCSHIHTNIPTCGHKQASTLRNWTHICRNSSVSYMILQTHSVCLISCTFWYVLEYDVLHVLVSLSYLLIWLCYHLMHDTHAYPTHLHSHTRIHTFLRTHVCAMHIYQS